MSKQFRWAASRINRPFFYVKLLQKDLEPVAMAAAPPPQHQHHRYDCARTSCRISGADRTFCVPCHHHACGAALRFANAIISLKCWQRDVSREWAEEGLMKMNKDIVMWYLCIVYSDVDVRLGGREKGKRTRTRTPKTRTVRDTRVTAGRIKSGGEGMDRRKSSEMKL